MKVEDYKPTGGAALAQRLSDEGLIATINTLILHPLGLALGVSVEGLLEETMTGTVSGLTLHQTQDPEGIKFEQWDAVRARAVEKLESAGVMSDNHHYSLLASLLESIQGRVRLKVPGPFEGRVGFLDDRNRFWLLSGGEITSLEVRGADDCEELR